MPRAKKSQNGKATASPNSARRYYAASDAEWGGYINLRMVEDERSDFDGWLIAEGDSLTQSLDSALVDGLKLSVSYDAENDCYIATFTGAGCTGDKSRYVLSARAGDWWEAVGLLLYKHIILLHEDWSNFRPATGRHTFG